MNDDQTPDLDKNNQENTADNAFNVDSELDAELAPEQADHDQEGDDIDNTEQKEEGIFSKIISGPMFTNIILAALFANFVYLHYNDYDVNQKFSSLLMMIQVSCVVLFFLIRIAPSKVSMDPKDWIVAVLGTALPMLIFPVSGAQEIAPILLLQFVGIFISTVAIISLNNSFGIVPAIREIKTKWLYGLIRHPIYFGYFMFMTCMVLQNLSIMNIIVLLGIYAADIYRIIAEERLLSEDPVYQNYKTQVKWRLLPFVW